MRALVTGGAGFIGSNLVDALLGRGDEVAVLDDLSTGRRENLAGALERGATLHEGDVADAAFVRETLGAARPQVVFHLAAQIDVRRSVADPGHDARVNVEGTVNVLEAARAAGTRRVVLSSTGGALYGDAETLPTPEEAPIAPLSPYGQAKHAAEGYCALATRLHGLSTIALRYANVYGPRQDPLGEGGVVAIFSARALDGRPRTINGDGGQTRDFVYVGDVVEANLLAADSDATAPCNVGCGHETSVLDLVAALDATEQGEPGEVRHGPALQGEVRRSCLDPARAEQVLGWQPRTALDEGLRRTLAWLRG